MGDVSGKVFGQWLRLWGCSWHKAEARRWAALVWELPAHGPRAEGTFRGRAATSELFHRDFAAGGNHKVTQTDRTGNYLRTGVFNIPALTAVHASQAETFLFLCQLAALSQMFPSCCLSETLKLLDRDRDTHMTINLQGLSYPHRGRNL